MACERPADITRRHATTTSQHDVAATRRRRIDRLRLAAATTPKTHDPALAAEEPFATIQPVVGDWYTLGQFGAGVMPPLRITIGYYIDSLTVLMFAMVTFIATCIHFYAIGYMHDELQK